MKILSIICAENIIRDVEANQILVYNLFDDISVSSFPILLPKFSVYFLSEKEEENDLCNVLLKILNNNKVIFSDTIQFNFKGRKKYRGVIRFNGLVIPGIGKLRVQFFKNESDLLRELIISLDANQQNVPLTTELPFPKAIK